MKKIAICIVELIIDTATNTAKLRTWTVAAASFYVGMKSRVMSAKEVQLRMTNGVELSHEEVSAAESKSDFSSVPVERQIKRRPKARRARNLPLDAKSADKVVRLILALPRKPDPNPMASAEPKEAIEKTNESTSQSANQDTKQNTNQIIPNLNDLIHVHVLGSARFESGGREDSYEVLNEIFCHPRLQALDEAAKMVATTYIFQARTAFRLKADGKYWVLSSLGAVYPYPLAIRTGPFPSWRSQIRSLEGLSKKLRKSASQALRLEADILVSSRPEQMPAEQIIEAETAIRKAISWMQAFPAPVTLRSKYRKIVRPETEESVGVIAYVLDRLYREHTGEPSLKAKEIEYRIADLETKFLGQNIQCGPDFGCPAVRLQIRTVKRSKMRTVVDRRLRTSFKMINSKMRENDPSRVKAAVHRFWKQWDIHGKAYDSWVERTEPTLKEQLRCTLEATTYEDEAFRAIDEYFATLRNHLNRRQRWIGERKEHLSALDSPDLDIWQYIKPARKWMRRWEPLWDFPM
jgi:hypothetical protein